MQEWINVLFGVLINCLISFSKNLHLS